jgi:hypothetical protein
MASSPDHHGMEKLSILESKATAHGEEEAAWSIRL